MKLYFSTWLHDHVDLIDAGVDADGVIDILRKRQRPAKELTLAHNPLGDAGLAHLLAYLRSPDGAALGVRSLGLNATGLGDGALLALARHFARAPEALEELFIQVNLFTGSAYPLEIFARSLSASHLRRLYLSSNALGDAGVGAFLGALDAPRLRELHLSATGLTDAVAPALCAFLGSRRSKGLRVLKMNGNQLGPAALGRLVKAIDDSNFSLETVEVFANDVPDGDKVLLRLGALLDRNRLLRGETRRSALHLLHIARIALLHPHPAPPSPSSSPPSTSTSLILRHARTPPPPAPEERVAWLALPYELRLLVLRFAVPDCALSAAQHARVCAYAEGDCGVWVGGVEEWLEGVGCEWYEAD